MAPVTASTYFPGSAQRLTPLLGLHNVAGLIWLRTPGVEPGISSL